ncbi:MAG TPA: hypothetical protein VGO37_10245 [Steroidobacteraceae bacterium]|jgi:hypothetical protein|nr:hypothetical protein [Steroidobacteraceae bacterium]
MTTKPSRAAAAAALALALTSSIVGNLAHAGMPSTAPYLTDLQSEYVQDMTSDGIASLNMVLCVISSMDAGAMVNVGPYIALVDMNKCDSKASSSGAAGATNYANAIVDVTRTSNSSPMIGKVWLSMAEGQGTTDVYAYISATQSPTASQPYGLFRMDYLGKKNGATAFNGFIDSQATSISQFETGPNSSNTAMALSAATTNSGSGTIASLGGTSYNFAYNANYFRRSDGTTDECFDRSKANAQVSVWQYGTYNAVDGSRVDLAHPGFPVLATRSGSTYYGFANYWGINFDGLDLNSIVDAQPIPGLAVSDQRPGNTTAYNLSKVGGKLTKWSQQATTLNSLNGIPVYVGADLTGLTTGNPAVTGYQNWVIQWSSANQSFTVTGTQQCSNNGCVQSNISPVALINSAAFANTPISGYANSYGGNINIPPTGSAHLPTDAVHYYAQSTVIPGSTPLQLYCLNQCPTAVSLAAFAAGNAQTTPYGNGTAQQWFSAPSANTVSYTFGAGGLEDASGGTAVPIVLEQSSNYPSGSQYAQSGINTGRLFDAPLTAADCPVGMPAQTVCEPANPSVYYNWVTGTQQWQQSLWLTDQQAIVAFDAPQSISYTVPADPSFGSYAGLPILLQFNGFGNLYGIPGSCVDPTTNAAVDCSTPQSRYVPLFAIPDGATMTLARPSTPLIVKALNAEIRLKNLGTSSATACASMTLSPVTLPSGGTHDPTNAADAEYLGSKPTVTAAPAVIDGVVQH